MKEKQKSTDTGKKSQQSGQTPRGSVNESSRSKESNKSQEDTGSKHHIANRARKGYHSDGPGGSYNGF